MFALQRISIFRAPARRYFSFPVRASAREKNFVDSFRAPAREYFRSAMFARQREREFFISNTRVSAGGKLLGHFRASARRIFSFISMSRAGVLCLGRRCRPWPRAPHWVWGQATNFQRERADSVKNTAHYSNCVRKIRKIFGKRPLSGKCKIFMFLL